jgi:hypothetical protein
MANTNPALTSTHNQRPDPCHSDLANGEVTMVECVSRNSGVYAWDCEGVAQTALPNQVVEERDTVQTVLHELLEDCLLRAVMHVRR